MSINVNINQPHSAVAMSPFWNQHSAEETSADLRRTQQAEAMSSTKKHWSNTMRIRRRHSYIVGWSAIITAVGEFLFLKWNENYTTPISTAREGSGFQEWVINPIRYFGNALFNGGALVQTVATLTVWAILAAVGLGIHRVFRRRSRRT